MATEWGTDNIYQTDTYNEMAPSENDAAFLNASSAAVFAAMVGSDPDAIWLMQGWLFHEAFWGDAQMKAYLGGVPAEKMWVLDLNTQARPVYTRNNGDGFYGHPYIWSVAIFCWADSSVSHPIEITASTNRTTHMARTAAREGRRGKRERGGPAWSVPGCHSRMPPPTPAAWLVGRRRPWSCFSQAAYLTPPPCLALPSL